MSDWEDDDDTDNEDKSDENEDSDNDESDQSMGEDDFSFEQYKSTWTTFARKTRNKYITSGKDLVTFLTLLKSDIGISERQCDTFFLMMQTKLKKDGSDPDKIDVKILFEFVGSALDTYEKENGDRTLEFAIGDAATRFNNSEEGKAHRRTESIMDMQRAAQLSQKIDILPKSGSTLAVPNENEASGVSSDNNNNNNNNNNNSDNNKNDEKQKENDSKKNKSDNKSSKLAAASPTPEYKETSSGEVLSLEAVSSMVVHESVTNEDDEDDDDDDDDDNDNGKASKASQANATSKGKEVTSVGTKGKSKTQRQVETRSNDKTEKSERKEKKETKEKNVKIDDNSILGVSTMESLNTDEIQDQLVRQESMLYRVYAQVIQLDQEIKTVHENDDEITDGLRSLKYLKSSSIAALHGELSCLKHDLYNIFESTSIESAQKVSKDIQKSLLKMDSKLGNTIRELRDEDYATQSFKLRCYEKLERLLSSIEKILGKYKSSVNRPIIVKKVILGDIKEDGNEDRENEDDNDHNGNSKYDTDNEAKSHHSDKSDKESDDSSHESDESDNENSESKRKNKRRSSMKKSAKEELFESLFGSQFSKMGIDANTAQIFTMKPFIAEIERVKNYLGSIDFYMNGIVFDKLSRLENILQRMYDYGKELNNKAIESGIDKFATKEEIEAKLKLEKERQAKQHVTFEEMKNQLEVQRLDYEQQLRKQKEQIMHLQGILETQKKLTAKSEELMRKEKDKVSEMQTVNEINAAKVNELKFELRRNEYGHIGSSGSGSGGGGGGISGNDITLNGRLGVLAKLGENELSGGMTGNLSSGGLETATGGEMARRRSERVLLYDGNNNSVRPRRNSGASSLGTVTTMTIRDRQSASPRSLPVGQQQEQELLLKFNYLDHAQNVNRSMNNQVSNEYSNKLSTLMSDFKHRAKLIQQAKWNDYEIYLRDKFGEYSLSTEEKQLKYLDISVHELPEFFAQRMKDKKMTDFVSSAKRMDYKKILDAENVLGYGWYELFFLYRENTTLNAKLNALQYENDCLNEQLTIRHLNEESWIYEKEFNKLKLEREKLETEKKMIDKYRLDMYRDMKKTEQELHTSLRYEQFQFDRQRKTTQELLDSERDGLRKDRDELEEMREELETKERMLEESMKASELVKKEFEIKVNLTGDDAIEAIATAKFEKHLNEHNELLEKTLRSKIESEMYENDQQNMNSWEQRWDMLKQERNRPLEKNEIALKEQISMYENEKKVSETLREEISQLKKEILELSSSISSLKGENSVLSNENERLKNKVERMEGFMLSRIEDAEIEKQFEDYDKQISDYRAKCEIYQRDRDKSISDYEQLMKEYNQLKNENGKYQSAISDLKKKLKDPNYLNEANFKKYLSKQQSKLISTLEKSDKTFNDIGAKYGQFKEKFRELHELMKSTEKTSKKLADDSKIVTKLSRDYHTDFDSWYIHKNHVLRSFFTAMEQFWWESFKTHELYSEITLNTNEKFADKMRMVLQDAWFECRVTNHTLIRWFARFNDYYSEKQVFFEQEADNGEQVYYWTLNLRKIIDDMRPAVISQYYKKQWQKRQNDKRFVLSENVKLKQLYYQRQREYVDRVNRDFGDQGSKYKEYLIKKFEKDANNQVRFENKQTYDEDELASENEDDYSNSESYSGSDSQSESRSGSQTPIEDDHGDAANAKLDQVELFTKLVGVKNERDKEKDKEPSDNKE